LPPKKDDDSRDEIERRLDREIEGLRHHATFSTNPCTVAATIAAADPDVRTRLLAKVREGDQFRGLSCPRRGAILFEFDCPPGVICLVRRSMLVLVDMAGRRVERIIDPFDPAHETEVPAPASHAMFAATASALGGESVLDAVIEILRDVFNRHDVEDTKLSDLGLDDALRALMVKRISQRFPGLSPELRAKDVKGSFTASDLANEVLKRLPNPGT